MNIKQYFAEYTHNLAVIYAHLEGQYPYELIKEEEYIILLTGFDYHYVAGKVPSDEDALLFEITSYIRSHQKEEFVLFAPNKEWEDFLVKAIKKLNGVVDARYLYQLKDPRLIFDPQVNTCQLEEVQNQESTTPLLQASIKEDGRIISKATALMTGNNHVEIDVFTEESHRGKGYAYQVSKTLIDALLKRNLTPDWCCWKIKTSSQALAKKLGFTFDQEIKAYVWVEEFGGV